MKADDIENIRMFSRVVIVLVFVYDGKDDGNLLVQNELICDMLWITAGHQLNLRNTVYSNALTWEVCGPEALLRT